MESPDKLRADRPDVLSTEPEGRSGKPVDSGRGRRYLEFIGYLQVIGIVLVVFGHSFHQYPDGQHGATLLIYRLCYSFRMPLFIFISGFLMVYPMTRDGYKVSIKEFTIKKFKRLLIPYVVLTLVTFFPRAAMSGLADDQLPMTWSGMFQSLYLTDMLPIPFFWFLQVSLVLLMFSYTLIAAGRKLGLSMGILLTVLLLCVIAARFPDWGETEIFGYRSAIRYGVFFIAGAAYSWYYEQIDKFIPFDNLVSFVVAGVVWFSSFFLTDGTEWWYATSFCGIAMWISVSKLLVKYKIRILDHLKGVNYLIFLLSWYINVLTQQVLSHFVTLPWWVHTLLSLTLGVYIPWLCYRFMQRNQHRRSIRFLTLILGQSFKKR